MDLGNVHRVLTILLHTSLTTQPHSSTMVSLSSLWEESLQMSAYQGSVVSAIGTIITTIITAIADVLIFIVNAIVTVSASSRRTSRPFWS